MAGNNFRSDRGRDPIAELARLISEARSHGESAAADSGFGDDTATDGGDEPPGLTPAPQLPGYLNAPEELYEFDENRHDDRAYDADDQLSTTDQECQIRGARLRRSLALAMAMFGLALLGTAGAFGYRSMFAHMVPAILPSSIEASNKLNKFAPASSDARTENSGNATQADLSNTGSIENVVLREEQPVGVSTPAAPASASSQAVPRHGMSHRAAAAADPASQTAGRSSAGDVTTASNNAHLAAAPIAPADANAAPAVTRSELARYSGCSGDFVLV